MILVGKIPPHKPLEPCFSGLTWRKLRAKALSETIMEVTAMSIKARSRSMAITLALGLVASTPAFWAMAQEATTTAPADATAAPADGTAPAAAPADGTAAAPSADTLSMGTDAPAADGIGSMYPAANFDAWVQRCRKTADGSDPCELYQLLKDTQGNPVAEYSMVPLKGAGEAVAGATIIAPLETLLTANLTLGIDGAKPKIYPFTFCTNAGCVARVGFTAAEIDQFKKGAKAVLTIVPAAAPDQKVTLDISLKGFTAGFAAVAATMPKDATPPKATP